MTPEVVRMLRDTGRTLHVLRLSKTGGATAPLYVADAIDPVVWEASDG